MSTKQHCDECDCIRDRQAWHHIEALSRSSTATDFMTGDFCSVRCIITRIDAWKEHLRGTLAEPQDDDEAALEHLRQLKMTVGMFGWDSPLVQARVNGGEGEASLFDDEEARRNEFLRREFGEDHWVTQFYVYGVERDVEAEPAAAS